MSFSTLRSPGATLFSPVPGGLTRNLSASSTEAIPRGLKRKKKKILNSENFVRVLFQTSANPESQAIPPNIDFSRNGNRKNQFGIPVDYLKKMK